MATEKLVQTSFVNGQYDREVQSKERSDFIGQGLAKALNVVSGEKGELRKRLGTRFLRSLDGATVLVPFRLPDGDDIILCCTDGNVKGYRFVGNELVEFTVPTGVAPTFPITGWSSNTNGDYTVALSDSTDYTGFNGASSPFYGKGSVYGNIPHVANTTTTVQIGSTSAQLLSKLRVRWCLTCSGEHKGHYKGWVQPILQYSDDGTNWVSVETDVVNPYMGGNFQASDKTAYFASYVYGSGSSKKTENYIVSDIKNVNHLEPHTYWRVYFLKSVYNDQTYSGESLELFISDVTYVPTTMTALDIDNAFFDGELLRNIKYSQHYTQMIMACVDKDPIQLDYSPSGLAITNFSGLPVGAEKPSCVQYFQQRLWFGGFNALPTTVMGSKIDVYNDFTEQTPLEFDDYLNLKCNQLKHQISNIIGGQKVLYSFSEDGLSCVDPRSSGMIATNQSIEFNLRNRMPSSGSTPAFKDDIMLYASSDGTKLYAVDYDLITERFQVDDLAKYAKDITFDKITELHYINDESKLIYGLLESGNMFALNYMKGAYQGFFPITIQDGFIYDIVQIKVGRNYKLLIVTCRSGSWFIEEMPDKGQYVDTIAPFMTKEDKKWATYDNINNNIALDCWQKYEDTIELTATLDYENLTLTTESDLSAFIGSQVMLGQLNDENQWVVLNIESSESAGVYNVTIDSYRGDSTHFDILYKSTTQLPIAVPGGTHIGVVSQGRYLGSYDVTNVGVLSSLYGWANGADVVYTNGDNPVVGDQLYDENGSEITDYYQNTVASIGLDSIIINERIESGTSQALYCWGDVYTLSATPSVGDQLYNSDGTLVNDYLYNTVNSVSGNTITTVETETPYSATYAWKDDNNNIIYTYRTDFTYGDTAPLTNGYSATVSGGDDTITNIIYNGLSYPRDSSKDGVYQQSGYSDSPIDAIGFTLNGDTVWTDKRIEHDKTISSALYYHNPNHPSNWISRKPGVSIGYINGTAIYITSPIYLSYNNVSYSRDVADDVPGGVTVTTKSFTRDSTGDIESQTISTIVTKTFMRASAYDLITDSYIVELGEPVFKATYGALYDAYAFIKIERPYESMKSVRQINLEVQNTMHLSVGTSLDDMQVLEDINDNTHYDLTNMTMNGGYVIVPGDTPEWSKFIIMKSDKGLPFTVNAVEVIINYSNEGGN